MGGPRVHYCSRYLLHRHQCCVSGPGGERDAGAPVGTAGTGRGLTARWLAGSRAPRSGGSRRARHPLLPAVTEPPGADAAEFPGERDRRFTNAPRRTLPAVPAPALLTPAAGAGAARRPSAGNAGRRGAAPGRWGGGGGGRRRVPRRGTPRGRPTDTPRPPRGAGPGHGRRPGAVHAASAPRRAAGGGGPEAARRPGQTPRGPPPALAHGRPGRQHGVTRAGAGTRRHSPARGHPPHGQTARASVPVPVPARPRPRHVLAGPPARGEQGRAPAGAHRHARTCAHTHAETLSLPLSPSLSLSLSAGAARPGGGQWRASLSPGPPPGGAHPPMGGGGRWRWEGRVSLRPPR